MCLSRFCKHTGLRFGDGSHPSPSGAAWRPFPGHSYCQLFGFSLVPLSQDADRRFLSSLILISCGWGLSPTNCCQEKNRKIITLALSRTIYRKRFRAFCSIIQSYSFECESSSLCSFNAIKKLTEKSFNSLLGSG